MFYKFFLVGYSAIAINTTIDEEVLMYTKKKGNKKNEAIEPKKDIPPPIKLNFVESDLETFKVKFFRYCPFFLTIYFLGFLGPWKSC